MGAETSDSWDGKQYEEVSGLQRRIGLRFVADLELGTVSRFLDVGCGDGYLTAAIAQKVRSDAARDSEAVSGLGIDASPGMIETARTRTDPSLHFEVEDVLSFRSDLSFDLIVSINTLHWVTDLPTAFARLAAVQPTGGRLAVQLVGSPEREARGSIEDVAMQIARSPAWAPAFDSEFSPYVHPSEEVLTAAVVAIGYGAAKTDSWQESFEFPSVRAFEEWCAVGMTIWTDHIEPRRRAEFVSSVVERYQEAVGRSATLFFNQTRLTATVGG